MSFDRHLEAHRRLSILRVLAEGGYSANESLIRDVVETFGVGATRDQVRGAIAWLADQGLVTAEAIAGLTIARITERGLDVAHGRASYPGVKRPSPQG